jgi:hypothetical protein
MARIGLLLFGFLFFLLAFQNKVWAQPQAYQPKAFARFDTITMLIGDQNVLHLAVDYLEGERVINITPNQPLDTTVFELLKAGKWANPSRNLHLERDIVFTVWDSGFYQIPPVRFTIQSSDGSIRTVETLPLLLSVNNPRGVDDMVSPIGIKDIEAESLAWEDVMPYLVLGILVLALSFLAWAIYRRWKRRELAPVVQKIVQPPHLIAERLLTELKEKKLWQQGKIKEYYSELSHILRGYLEDQFTMPALEITTDELIRVLENRQFESLIVAKTQGLLQAADLVKFAKVEPPIEAHDTFWTDAWSIVAETKPKPIVVESEA